jgi:thioredoxin 1
MDTMKMGMLAALTAALVAAAPGCTASAGPGAAPAPAPASPPASQAAAARPVPRLVDLGSVGCIPCKAMAPILDGLKAEYAGRMEVEFIDVWKNRDAADAYGVRMIPTQVFFGADGQELARHQGFMGKDEILAQWKAVGVSF